MYPKNRHQTIPAMPLASTYDALPTQRPATPTPAASAYLSISTLIDTGNKSPTPPSPDLLITITEQNPIYSGTSSQS